MKGTTDFDNEKKKIEKTITEYSASMGYLTAIMGRELLANDKREMRQKILKWLSKFDYWQRHKDLQTKRVATTGTWIFDCNEYQDWRTGKDSRFLICYGIRISRLRCS